MERGAAEVGRGTPEGGVDEGRVFHGAAEGADRVEAGTERDDAFERQRAVGGFEADKIVPCGGQADRTAGVGADPGCGEAEGDGCGGAGGGSARGEGRVVDVGGRAGDGVEAETREREFRQVGLAKADEALRGGVGDDAGIVGGHPALQERGSGFGGGSGSIVEILPGDRDPVEGRAAGPVAGAVRRRAGLGQGPVGGRPGIDPVVVGVGENRGEVGFGERDGVDFPRVDPLPQRRRRHP